MDDIIYSQAVRRAREQYTETTHSPENSCLDDEFWCPEDKVCKKNKDRINEGGEGWTSEGLRELEPHELLQFISEALPKFLQTHYNPQDYDEIRSSLYSAAELLNDPYNSPT